MICTEYFPAITHSDDPDCNNCKYKGIIYCTNVRVKQFKKQWSEYKKQLKDNEQH